MPTASELATGVIEMEVGAGAYYWVSEGLSLNRRSVGTADTTVLDRVTPAPGLRPFLVAGDGFAVWGQQDAFVGPTQARVAWDDGRPATELPSSMWASAPQLLLAHQVDTRPVLIAATSEPTSAQPDTPWLTDVQLDTGASTPRFPTFALSVGRATVQGPRAWVAALDQAGVYYATFDVRTPTSLTVQARGLRSPLGPFVTPDGVYVVDNDLDAHVHPRLYRIEGGDLALVADLGTDRFDEGVFAGDAFWLLQRRERRLTRVDLDGGQRTFSLPYVPERIMAAGDHLAVLLRDASAAPVVRYSAIEQPLPE